MAARNHTAVKTVHHSPAQRSQNNLLHNDNSEFPAKVNRPAYSVLDKTKIEDFLNFPIPSWIDSLSTFLLQVVRDKEEK